MIEIMMKMVITRLREEDYAKVISLVISGI